VERIPFAVEAGRLDVHELARAYLADNLAASPAYHAGQWWEYRGTHYRPVSPEYLDGRLRLWLTGQGVGPKPQAVSNLMAQIRAVVHVDPDAAMPGWVNADAHSPEPGRVIAFRNGLLDVERFLAGDSGLIPHMANWFSAVCLPYAFDPAADCPRWRRCLGEWLVEDDQIELLQSWFGYNLATDNSLQKFMFLLGPPRSGKSTTLNVLTQVLGRQNVAASTFQSLAGEFGLANLVGKQALTISEIHADRSAKGVVQVIKNITGNDPVPVNRKGLPIVSLTLPVRITVAANQLPRLPDDSNALAARMLLLHYPNTYLGKEDHGIAEALAAEIPGIANWALAGLRRLRQTGRFTQPDRGKECLDDFGNLSSPVEQFLADCCEEGPAAWEATEHLHDAWIAWCVGEGHEPGSRNVFGSKLKAARPEIRNGQRRTPAGRKIRYYAGVQLTAEGIAVLERRLGRPAIKHRNEARATQAVSGCPRQLAGPLSGFAVAVSG